MPLGDPRGCPNCKSQFIIKRLNERKRTIWRCLKCGKEWEQLKFPYCMGDDNES